MKRYAIQVKLNRDVDMWQDLEHYHDMSRSYALGAWSMLKSHYNNVAEYRLVIYKDVSKRKDLEAVSFVKPRKVGWF